MNVEHLNRLRDMALNNRLPRRLWTVTRVRSRFNEQVGKEEAEALLNALTVEGVLVYEGPMFEGDEGNWRQTNPDTPGVRSEPAATESRLS